MYWKLFENVPNYSCIEINFINFLPMTIETI